MYDKETEETEGLGAEQEGTTEQVEACLTPQVFDLPNSWGPTKRSVVGLACFNLPAKDIAKQLTLPESQVKAILKDTQVKAITDRGAVVRKMFISSMAEVLVLQLFRGIKLKDLEGISLKERIDLIEKAVKIIQNLNVKPMKEDKNDQDLVDDLKKDAAMQQAQEA
jgi:hypothetical protein